MVERRAQAVRSGQGEGLVSRTGSGRVRDVHATDEDRTGANLGSGVRSPRPFPSGELTPARASDRRRSRRPPSREKRENVSDSPSKGGGHARQPPGSDYTLIWARQSCSKVWHRLGAPRGSDPCEHPPKERRRVARAIDALSPTPSLTTIPPTVNRPCVLTGNPAGTVADMVASLFPGEFTEA